MFGAKRRSTSQPTALDERMSPLRESSSPVIFEPISPETEPLLAAKRKSPPGACFKAKIDGQWREYAPSCNKLLLDAYAAGCPSMRLNVKGHMYKFDFEKMEQKCLNTMETHEMRAPHSAERPIGRSLFKKGNLTKPLTNGRKSLRDNFSRTRPVLVVRVPNKGPGEIIHVPHPQKLGKALKVFVPEDAKVGQPLFVPVPRKDLGKKVRYGVGGTAIGIGTAVAVDTAGHAIAGGTAVGFAGLTGGPAILGALAVGGLMIGAGYGVSRYAKHNPAKFVAIGVLTLGGLALADHIAEVGVVEGVGDVVEGVGDVFDGVRVGVEDVVDGIEDGAKFAEDFGEDAIDWFEDVAGDGVDFIEELF